MRHLLLAVETAIGQTVRLESQDHHYLTRVLRFSVGDRFTVLDGAGRTFSARILEIRDQHLDALVEAPAEIRTPAFEGEVTIFQAIPKGRRLDDVIRQTVQAGATRIVPMVTERTVARIDDSQSGKLDRWRRVAREAVQQSGAPQQVEIAPAVELSSVGFNTHIFFSFLNQLIQTLTHISMFFHFLWD